MTRQFLYDIIYIVMRGCLYYIHIKYNKIKKERC
nr:MAG TPA: hypothetical protein [Caudoviricetes sp.]